MFAPYVHDFLFNYPIQILQQATHRLQMSGAARRLYTADGVIILDLDDLVTWAQGQYVRDAKRQLRADAKKAAEEDRQGNGKRDEQINTVPHLAITWK